MFLPILLSLGLLGASATSVGKGNCPTDAELLKSFSAPSKTLDLNWLAQMKEKCAKGNCEEVSKEIWDISWEKEAIIKNARKSLSCRSSIYPDSDCYQYNMPISQANEIIPGLGENLFARESSAINKIRPYRNELLYRVGWYKDPEFEECNYNALVEEPKLLEPQVKEAESAPAYELPPELVYIKATAPTGIASYDNYLAGEGLLSVEGTTPVAEEAPETWVDEQTPVVEETIETQASLFAQKQKSNNIMLKVLTNTLETYSDTVEEITPAVEETPESPVEEPTTIEAQDEDEEGEKTESEMQVNKPASKSWWKFWQRRAA